MKTQKKTRRLSILALALALSAGTVGGMMSFAAMTTAPAMAQAAAGGGGNGGNAGGNGGGNGGEPGNIMNNGPITHARTPNRQSEPPIQRARPDRQNCNGSQELAEIEKCKYTLRTVPRIVRINGFANCAVVQQMPSPNGGPTEFYCLKSM